MKSKNYKPVVYIALVGVILCVAAYAGKDRDEDVTLPEAVVAAVTHMFSNATIEEAKLDEEEIKVYEVDLEANGQDVAEMTVAPDGTIVEVETEIAADDLPLDVKNAIAQAAEGAEIKEVKKEDTHAVVKLVPLDQPQTSYEVELVKDGKKCEIEVAADGTIVEGLECKKHDDDEDEDEDDDNDNDEEQVSINDVPQSVKATIMANAVGGTVKEIERETEDGKIIYEAEVIINGKEVEVKVGNDGKLLGKEVDDDDDNDEHKEK